ncbi:hypothetical protein ACP275_09G046900 [Erythranthe tilingii]
MVSLHRNQLEELKELGLEAPSELKVISLVGMAGIGKTTLVQEFYHDPLAIEYFDHRLFLTIGPQYKLREILLSAFNQLGGHHSDGEKIHISQLADYIQKSLHDSTYLIVLDDVWNTQAWDMVKHCFPSRRRYSRIIVTTQILDLALYISGHINIEIPLLNDDESWNLLRRMVFDNQEECSRQLEKIGRKIAKNCEGLPFAITEVAKILRKIEKTVEEWEIQADKEDPLTITLNEDTPLSKAISLSYTRLPPHLKLCFLYMGVFPKGYAVPISQLIQLWVSEGLFEPRMSMSLEETMGEYLRKLVQRNVVLNNKVSSIDIETTKTCRLHFTFRSLCVNEAKNEKFFHVIKKITDVSEESINSQRRLCIHNNVVLAFEQVHKHMESVEDACSLLCFGPKQKYPIELYLRFKLLKILDAVSIRFYDFPEEILELLQLSYLSITCDGDEIPPSISNLQNLEVLIVHRHHIVKSSPDSPVYLPEEIWKIHKIKHLECVGMDLPEPSSLDDSLTLEKLSTLSGVSARSCTVKILSRIPNLKKVGIQIETEHGSSFETFSFLNEDHFASLYEKFESFKCVVVNPRISPSHRFAPSIPNFPAKIRKITLSGCGFPWECMRSIASLPNLVSLKLRWHAFSGREWKTGDGEFPKLEYLLLEDLDLQKWEVKYNHFPQLMRLNVRHCYRLEKLRRDFAYVPALVMEVDDCRRFATKELEEEIFRFNKNHLQIAVNFSWDDKKKTNHDL